MESAEQLLDGVEPDRYCPILLDIHFKFGIMKVAITRINPVRKTFPILLPLAFCVGFLGLRPDASRGVPSLRLLLSHGHRFEAGRSENEGRPIQVAIMPRKALRGAFTVQTFHACLESHLWDIQSRWASIGMPPAQYACDTQFPDSSPARAPPQV